MKLTTYSKLTRDQVKKHDSHLWRYTNGVTGVQHFQLFHQGKITRNYTSATCYHVCNIGNYLIKRQSERYITL